MIVGLGMDLVELQRIQYILTRFSRRFSEKLLHPEESAVAPAGLTNESAPSAPSTRLIEWTAGRFAAKEAAVKALGTGFAEGIHFHDLRILPDPAGKPRLFLYGRAAAAARALGADTLHLSLTHTKTHAGAIVVLEAVSY